jgi:hypothetical protein
MEGAGMPMDSGTISSILSLIGTLSGSFGGIIVSSKLTNYRIEQLEKKVDRHNSFAERMPVMEEQIKVINHRLEDLEHENQRQIG